NARAKAARLGKDDTHRIRSIAQFVPQARAKPLARKGKLVDSPLGRSFPKDAVFRNDFLATLPNGIAL
ncbi:MAG: hypothetical protein KJS68_15535, partial [Alphaproteobacteria bacterium]|nr:hypothetical protein [Alphaproteobacteria bacterium]